MLARRKTNSGSGTKSRAFPLAAACLLAITSQAAGQVSIDAESLRGLLDGLRVVVEPPSSGASNAGLTESFLQTYLETRLREARIPITSEEMWLASMRKGYVYLSITDVQLNVGGWVYSMRLEVQQNLCISGWTESRGPLGISKGCLLTTTWSRGGLYLRPGLPLANSVRDDLAGMMDELVNDYLAVNP